MLKHGEATLEAVLDPATLEVRASEPSVAAEAAPPPLPRRVPRPIPTPIPTPIPFLFGSRVRIWKQDPSVRVLGRRLAFMPGVILDGPRNARVDTSLPGTTPVVRNTNGDFLFPSLSPESDCVHTFSVINQALRMWEQSLNGKPIPWAWNNGGNTNRITCRPRGFTGANAFYSRSQKALTFGFFVPPGGSSQVFTCRSLDIVAHEAGHAILDGLKPGWLGVGNVPQTGAMHEAFGDITAIFLALSQFDQVETFVSRSKANLHDKTFLASVAEEFGAALGRTGGLRNADNNLRLSEVGNGVHSLSQVFTGAIYDILADIFVHERIRQGGKKELTQILFEVAQHLRTLILDAMIAAPATGATFTDVANQMLKRSKAQRDPAIYRHFIRNRFRVREVVVPATPLAALPVEMAMTDYEDAKFSGGDGDVTALVGSDHVSCTAGVQQDRSDCCGTMQLPEYAVPEKTLQAVLKKLQTGVEVSPDEGLLTARFKELEKAFAS